MTVSPRSRLSIVRDCFAIPGAIGRLALARIELRLADARSIQARNAHAVRRAARSPAKPGALDRVSRVLPWVAARVPWRSDCLVVAMAAQDWLAPRGVASAIELGVDRIDGGIEAHAWLRAGDQIVTGGPVDRYAVVLSPGANAVIAGDSTDL